MASDLIIDSLRRRMRAMHSLYQDACASMGPEHVNHFERQGVLPIAFSLFHYVNMEDTAGAVISGDPLVWSDEWRDRLQMAIPDHGKERTVAEMVDQRIGDYDAFQAYQATVFARTEGWLGRLDPAELERLLIPRPLPPAVAGTFSARVAGEEGITVLDAVECWLYQHGLRHMGEIELARGLVGLGGMTS